MLVNRDLLHKMEEWVMADFVIKDTYLLKRTVHRGFLVILCLYICCLHVTESVETDDKHCVHGTLLNNTCVCSPGWAEKNCDKCYGRSDSTSLEGYISDGVGNYSLYTKCSWLINVGEPNKTVWFHFLEFATECGWDHLYIHDGDSVYSPVLAAFSGLMISANTNSTETGFGARLSQQYLYVHFSSDAAYTMAGFNVSYSISDCKMGCSNQGICNMGICQCNEGYTGVSCETVTCPNNCSNRGDCISGICSCDYNYKGDDCSLEKYDAEWTIVKTSNPPVGRASHTAIKQQDSMWIVSGYSLSDQDRKNLQRYDFNKTRWMRVPEPGVRPPVRYAVGSDVYKDNIYMYGGVADGHILSDLWRYNIVTYNWTQLSSSQYNVSGHTAHIVDGIMYVFFGYCPKYGYLSVVQEYDIDNDTWSVTVTNGATVQGGYGHTSTFDIKTKLIFVYGGYHSDTQSGHNLTDKLFMYNILTATWTVLRNSGSPRYLHSAVITDGLLLIFGGNTHNDTSVSHGAKCYSTDFMLYNIACNSWHSLPPPNLIQSLSRYGQSMIEHSGSVYMFGGFNGLMLNDLVQYTPGSCGLVNDKETCNSIQPATSCIWYKYNCVKRSEVPEADQPDCNPSQGGEEYCKRIRSCSTCEATSYDCVWCGLNQCSYQNCTAAGLKKLPYINCSMLMDNVCSLQHNCYSCMKYSMCRWDKVCKPTVIIVETENALSTIQAEQVNMCELPCSTYTSCESCTQKTCMWCSNMKQCVETNSYVVSFPYGQCTDWTTKDDKCPATRCSGLKSCSECQANSMCGWCNDPSNTGLGRCMEGGANGAVDDEHVTNTSYCPAERWHFTQCPLCQCNGHSTCIENSSTCEDCQDLTEGQHCQFCKSGFYGNPRNGGNCTECECNGQADTCDRESGVCHCRTRGVTGEKCDMCDKNHSYVGNPKDGGTCYYQLVTDYQFTFNLSKYEDRFFTQINFKNTPDSDNRDVDFTLNCSGFALINITTKSKSNPEEEYFTVSHECDLFRTKFEHKDYNFGGDENTTFLVYVYGYQTPFWLVVSFSQFPKIDLVHFFVTFFSCFLSLLLIAAALWKIKHKYDTYRRRQLMIVEMQQMASRPFASVTVEIDRKKQEMMSAERKETREQTDTYPRKRKKMGPAAVAIEPLQSHKAAILSLVIQLPIGQEDYVPNGQTGVAIGSTIVTLGHTRKQSVEHIKGDKSKFRKHFHHTHPETCA